MLVSGRCLRWSAVCYLCVLRQWPLMRSATTSTSVPLWTLNVATSYVERSVQLTRQVLTACWQLHWLNFFKMFIYFFTDETLRYSCGCFFALIVGVSAEKLWSACRWWDHRGSVLAGSQCDDWRQYTGECVFCVSMCLKRSITLVTDAWCWHVACTPQWINVMPLNTSGWWLECWKQVITQTNAKLC